MLEIDVVLGFDPWDVSARALADLIEKEKVSSYRPPQPPVSTGMSSAPLNHLPSFHPRLKLMPPGFMPNGFPPNTANLRHPGKCVLCLAVKLKVNFSILHKESVGRCSSPCPRPLAYRWRTTDVCDTWPVRHQTYGYLPSRKASPPIHWYQYCLVTEAHVC